MVAAREDPSLIRMPPSPELKVKPMDSLPPLPNEIPPPPLTRLNPTNEDLTISPLPATAPPMETLQFEEPASLGAGARDGRVRPTCRRGKVVGGGRRSKHAVPIEKEGAPERPVRPRGGSPPGDGALGWKATLESPRRPRGGGRRSAHCCGGVIGERREERRCRLYVSLHRRS